VLVKSVLITSPDKPKMLGVFGVGVDAIGVGVEALPLDSGEETGVDIEGGLLPEIAFKIFAGSCVATAFNTFAGSGVVATFGVEALPLDNGEGAVFTGVGVGVGVGVGIGVGAVNCEYALLTTSVLVP
jgi:hypothetical protein